jgi:lipopolysaccharide export system ATP-binding protein
MGRSAADIEPREDPEEVPAYVSDQPSRALRGQGLVKAYRQRRVVDGVDISVRPGEVVGLLGPNGAGKTTTFCLLIGLVSAGAGRVYLDGRDITSLPMHRRSRLGLGYLPQEASIFRKMTVEQNLLALLEMVGLSRREQRQRVEQLLTEFDIARIRAYKGNQVSGGERRRVEVARALCTRPRYLLLDEPFLGVDPITVVEIQEIIADLRGRGIGVILTDHNVWDTLRITDRAYVMYEGKVLVAGTPPEIAASPLARRFYLGDRFQL